MGPQSTVQLHPSRSGRRAEIHQPQDTQGAHQGAPGQAVLRHLPDRPKGGRRTCRGRQKGETVSQVFVCEQLLYTPKAAKMHKTKGDLYGPLAEGGFKGHPMCEFCRNRFFSETELFKHNSEKHETCFLCRQENPHIYRYYRDYADLEGRRTSRPCAADETGAAPQSISRRAISRATIPSVWRPSSWCSAPRPSSCSTEPSRTRGERVDERRGSRRTRSRRTSGTADRFNSGSSEAEVNSVSKSTHVRWVTSSEADTDRSAVPWKEYAPSDRIGDGAEVSPDPNGFPESRPVQLTEEDFPSFGDVPCPTQGTWPVRGGRTGSLTGGAHFPSLPRQAPEGRPQVVRRGGETMASRVAATRSPVQTRPGGAVENLILQSVRRPASMPSLRQGLPTETKTANWPVQRERKEPASEPKSTTAWVTLSKGGKISPLPCVDRALSEFWLKGSAKDFPSLSGEEAHRVASKPKWGLSQEQPAPEPKPQPRPAGQSSFTAGTAATSSRWCAAQRPRSRTRPPFPPSPVAHPQPATSAASHPERPRRPRCQRASSLPIRSPSLLQSRSAADRTPQVLIKKLKSQMDSATFQEFHSDAQVFLREGLSADVFHRRLVDRGLAHYVAEVASLCPILSRGQELLSVHSQFIDQCREVCRLLPPPPPPACGLRIRTTPRSSSPSPFWSSPTNEWCRTCPGSVPAARR